MSLTAPPNRRRPAPASHARLPGFDDHRHGGNDRRSLIAGTPGWTQNCLPPNAYGVAVAKDAAAGAAHGFVPALTSFVGRARALDEVAGLLGESRLVTVTGPGGVGKTRLAGEVAARAASRFADGAWLVELAGVTDPARVPSAVAGVLGVRERPGVPMSDSLAAVLARQQMLLVLDSCEHVVAAVAQLCGALLPAADDMRVLATSREPVGVSGEARYRLPPLALPAPGDEAGGSDAVVLFADRARRFDMHFSLSGESGPVVARLVQRLDGMPLAIELAAARVEALGVTQLLDRLDERFGLLAGGDRLAAARHRSLAATVEWSYQLLSEQEQRVFRQVSVFPAPFTLEGAQAVAGAAAGPVTLRLVDCSLLAPPRTGPDGRARYLMLDTLRGYGAGRLADCGERPAAAAALARYALGVAEQAAAGMRAGAGELPAARWLDAEGAGPASRPRLTRLHRRRSGPVGRWTPAPAPPRRGHSFSAVQIPPPGNLSTVGRNLPGRDRTDRRNPCSPPHPARKHTRGWQHEIPAHAAAVSPPSWPP